MATMTLIGTGAAPAAFAQTLAVDNYEGGVPEPGGGLPDNQRDAIADRLEDIADQLEARGLTEQAEELRERAAEIRGEDGEVCICPPPDPVEAEDELGPDVL